jgi:hypothetical protein
MDSVLSPRQFNALVDHLSVLDLSEELLGIAPMAGDLQRAARDSGAGDTTSSESSFEGLFDAVADRLREAGPDAVVIVDSLTALERATEFGLDWGRVVGFLSGLRAAAGQWGGLVTVLYHARPEHVRSDHTVNSALDGCIYFYANDEGTSAAKTMRIGEFGGALSRRHQVVYKTQVGERGFTVSTTRGL